MFFIPESLTSSYIASFLVLFGWFYLRLLIVSTYLSLQGVLVRKVEPTSHASDVLKEVYLLPKFFIFLLIFSPFLTLNYLLALICLHLSFFGFCPSSFSQFSLSCDIRFLIFNLNGELYHSILFLVFLALPLC